MTSTIKVVKRDISTKDAKKNMQALAKGFATAGVHIQEGKEQIGDITMGHLANIQEFGTGNIPARMFIRIFRTAKYSKKLTLRIRQEAKSALLGRKGFWQRIADFASGEIKERIIRGEVKPDLAMSTISSRRSQGIEGTRPLYATGRLYRAIKGRGYK